MGAFFIPVDPVGASRLAMVVNENAGLLVSHGVLETIASVLAPTESPSDRDLY
jgi:hypothetical protein